MSVTATASPAATAAGLDVFIGIGGTAIALHTSDPAYAGVLRKRFGSFVCKPCEPALHFDIELITPSALNPDDDVRVSGTGSHWKIERSDFSADIDLGARRAIVRQLAHPYATDTVIRIVHTLLLASREGFLLHASSGIRNGRAYVFFGPSGAGKSTIAGLAPPDVTLLTDEVSYIIRKTADGYVAHGTPFTGELGQMGEPVSAPVAGFFRLIQGPDNRIEPISSAAAVNELLESVLFFTNDKSLVNEVFETVCDVVATTPVQRLVCRQDPRVWELMQ